MDAEMLMIAGLSLEKLCLDPLGVTRAEGWHHFQRYQARGCTSC